MNLNGTLSNLPPIMDQQTFADRVGISKRQVEDFIDKGYLPTVRLKGASSTSKRSFVNIVAFQEWLLDSGSEWLQGKEGDKS